MKYFENIKKAGSVITALLAIIIVSFTFSSCNEKEDPQPTELSSVTLVYMVANNNLWSFSQTDLQEMLLAVRSIDTKRNRLLVYYCGKKGVSRLIELTNNNGIVEQIEIKQYAEDMSSCDPARVEEVIKDVVSGVKSDVKLGLILWSHAEGWIPSNNTTDSRAISIERDKRKWFGDDGGIRLNITDLAEVLPDNLFHYIWADCCFMGNIETAYQFRNKCEYFIGSPTEILGEGMPYERTLPKLMKREPDLVGAADALHNYFLDMYPSSYGHNTIAVYKMDEIENVAGSVKNILMPFTAPVSSRFLQTYSRLSFGPFYDLTDYVEQCAEAYGTTELLDDFQKDMDKFVIFKKATPVFLGIAINQETYSGISTHCYEKKNTIRENYYRQMDWYKAVYPESANP